MRVPKNDPFFGGELSAQPSLVPDPNDFTSGSPQLALPYGGAVGNVPYLYGEGVRMWVYGKVQHGNDVRMWMHGKVQHDEGVRMWMHGKVQHSRVWPPA
jgi:hypothetical protein